MTYSEIKITFNQDLAVGEVITIKAGDIPDGLQFLIVEEWQSFRSSSNQVSLGIPTSTVGERSAINFVAAFNLDYNATGIYTVSRIENEVTIKCTNSVIRFDTTGVTPANPSSVIFEINNFTGTAFGIDSITFSQATNPCTHVTVNVTTSEVATNILSPINIIGNTDNPFSFEYLRSVGIVISCENSSGQTTNQTVNLPASLHPDNITFTINNSPEGATVIVALLETFGLDLQYSLDNATWQVSNTFTGIPPENYTLYVKDQYGCNVSKSFSVDEFGINSPYSLISKSNSIRYALRKLWGDCSNYKNDDNTLSYEADVEIPYTEIQQFQSCDIIRTQFRSNFDENLAVVIKEDGQEINMPVVQKTNNMRLKDRRDARKYDLGDGKTGIYFINGNIYNYDTGLDTGEDYVLNGALPVWGVSGNYIKLDDIWLFIESVIFDESRNAEVLVVDNVYSGIDTIVQASCFYNLFNYEVYEFDIDMFNYLDQNIRVRINKNDSYFENVEYLSECINVKVRQKNTVEIRYKNKTNTDIFYATGIENKIRILINKVNGKISDESETYKTDSSAILLSSEIHELDEFIFEPVTKGIMYKIVQALSHSDVKIDGVQYVKSENIEIEGALEDTNLYIVSAVMIKTSSVYNSNTSSGGFEFTDSVIEIPGLLDSGDGFVTY